MFQYRLVTDTGQTIQVTYYSKEVSKVEIIRRKRKKLLRHSDLTESFIKEQRNSSMQRYYFSLVWQRLPWGWNIFTVLMYSFLRDFLLLRSLYHLCCSPRLRQKRREVNVAASPAPCQWSFSCLLDKKCDNEMGL